MPITGLTNQTTFGSGLPRIATLYKGDEKPEAGNRPGKDLDYFRIEFEPEYELLCPVWTEMYGDTPDWLGNVFVAHETVDEAFGTWKEEWTATALLHRCDGENQVLSYDLSIGQYIKAKLPCAKTCGCKPTGRLNLVFPDFIEATGALGYITITTHSINDILTIHRYLSDIEKMHGKLTGVPFNFGRKPSEISVPKPKGKPGERMKVTRSLLYLHVTRNFTLHTLLPQLASGVKPGTVAPVSSEGVLPEGEAKRLLGGGDTRRVITTSVDTTPVIVNPPAPAPGQPATPTPVDNAVADQHTPPEAPQNGNGAKIDATLLMNTALEKHGLKSTQVLAKLGVSDLRYFTGTFEDALALCNPFGVPTSAQPDLPISTALANQFRD